MRTAPPSVLPVGDEKRRAVRQMFDAIAGRYQMVNRIMSLGLDRGWRRRCIEALELGVGSQVLDVACGTGDLCRDLAGRGYRAVGLDLSPGMLAAGRPGPSGPAMGGSKVMGRRGREATADGVPLVLGDALSAPFRAGGFDGAVSGFALRNVVDLAVLFAELARLVRPGGRVALLDLGEPDNPALRLGHHIWCSYGVPLVGAALSDAPAYRYLPRSLAYLPRTDDLVGLLEEAGFAAVQREPLTGGVAQLFVATRRPS